MPLDHSADRAARPNQARPAYPVRSRLTAPQASAGRTGGGSGGMRCSAVRERRQRPPSRSPLPAGASGDPSQVRRRDQAGIRPKRRYVNRHRPRRGEERKGGAPSLATAQAVCCPPGSAPLLPPGVRARGEGLCVCCGASLVGSWHGRAGWGRGLLLQAGGRQPGFEPCNGGSCYSAFVS